VFPSDIYVRWLYNIVQSVNEVTFYMLLF